MTPGLPFRTRVFLYAFFVAACAAGTGGLWGEELFEAIGREVNRVFLTARGAVVRVWARQGEITTVGTGFFVGQDGTLFTASGILGLSKDVSVELEGRRYVAQVLGSDRRSGVALLRANVPKKAFTTLAIGDSSTLEPGSPVVAVGFPLNLPPAPSFGLIVGTDTQFLSRFFPTSHLRTDLPVSPGQIGSPLLNGHCEVVGMLVMVADGRRLTYALPSRALERVREDLLAYGRVRYGWVGVEVEEASEEAPEGHTARISRLIPGTPAAASGLQVGDIVMELDGTPIHRPREVVDPAFYARVGQRTSLAVLRGGTILRFSLPVVERPVLPENGMFVAPKGPSQREVQGVNVSAP
jgi:serine protease Do